MKPIWKVTESQRLKNSMEKISRGNDAKLHRPDADVHTNWQLPWTRFWAGGGIYSETRAVPQITWSHPKSLEEPQQFHMRKFLVFSLKGAFQILWTSGSTTPGSIQFLCIHIYVAFIVLSSFLMLQDLFFHHSFLIDFPLAILKLSQLVTNTFSFSSCENHVRMSLFPPLFF